MEKLVDFVFSLALLSFTLNAATAENYAYFVANTTYYFKCSPLPHHGLCSDNFHVLTDHKQPYVNLLTAINSTMQDSVSMGLINQTCADTVVKSTCLGIGRCQSEKVSVDVDAALAECEKGNAVCPDYLAKRFFNCTENKMVYESSNRDALVLKCEKITGNTGICDVNKYKFPQYSLVDYSAIFLGASKFAELAKPPLVSNDCHATIKSTVCLVASKVCTDDDKYIVSFISKQKCENNLNCIPAGLMKTQLLAMCSSLPDANNSTIIPFSNGNIPSPTTESVLLRSGLVPSPTSEMLSSTNILKAMSTTKATFSTTNTGMFVSQAASLIFAGFAIATSLLFM